MRTWFNALLITLLTFGLAACEGEDPMETGAGGAAGEAGAGGEAGAAGEAGAGGEAGAAGEAGVGGEPTGDLLDGCEAHPEDYPGDAWPECISDDGTYHAILPDNISTIPRVASFETIADLLWRSAEPPSAEAFLDARIEYSIDEGLDSRVQRRYDPHFPAPEDGSSCRDEGVPEQYPVYCVGPAQILPVIVAAFQAGSEGMEPWINAARVEAALLWFLYASTYKEAVTCAGAAKDCDSAWAYYTGGVQLDGEPIGIAGYINALEPQTHRRVFHGILGNRCWRDIDDGETAMDDAMHGMALRQIDAALDRGLAVILIARLEAWANSDGDARAAAWAFLEVLGPVIDRAARDMDPAIADRLLGVWDDAASADADAIIADLEALFPCN